MNENGDEWAALFSKCLLVVIIVAFLLPKYHNVPVFMVWPRESYFLLPIRMYE